MAKKTISMRVQFKEQFPIMHIKEQHRKKIQKYKTALTDAIAINSDYDTRKILEKKYKRLL